VAPTLVAHAPTGTPAPQEGEARAMTTCALLDRLNVERLVLARCEPVPLLEALAARGCNRVLWECGPELAAAALRQGCVQELAAVIAPKLLGGLAARTPLGNLGLEGLDQVQSWRGLERRDLGSDLLWELESPEPPAIHAGLTTMGAGIARTGSAP